MRKTLGGVVALALLCGSTAAHAGFIAIDNVAPGATTMTVVNSNNFKSQLGALGIGTYTLGESLGVDAAGTVDFYYYGKEAGYRNVFTAGSVSKDSGYAPTWQNYFGAPQFIGSLAVGAGPAPLGFGFCAYNGGANPLGCVSNAANDRLGLNSAQSIALNITSSTAWIFWDDSGAGPDDNHDDMLIKAVFRPAQVPETGTLALLAAGLLGVAFARRRVRA